MNILIIIPCYNEEASIGNLLEDFKVNHPDFDILVVDDCSNDRTFKVASRYTKCIKLVFNLGIGGAVQTGIKYASENGYDFCIQVDGDGQHPPDQVQALIDRYQKNPANIIIGSRFLSDGLFKSTRCRRIGINIIRFVFRLLFRIRISDPTSGLRLMDAKAIRLFAKEYPRDFPEPISAAHAIRNGLTCAEVPVNMKPREGGQSSIEGLKNIAYMVRVIGYLLLTRMGRGI